MKQNKSYVIEKQVTNKYEVIDMVKFMKYDFFVKARKGMRSTSHTCFRCGRKFNKKRMDIPWCDKETTQQDFLRIMW